MTSRIVGFRRALHLTCRKNQSVKNANSRFSELQVEIRTCGELYEKWRKENRYWKIPKGNLDFKITYIDTAVADGFRKVEESVSSSKPIAVVLHGAPGSYHDFSSLTLHLHKNGVRVVIPNLPDFSVYKPGIFRQSAEEKTQLVKDFLRKINVPKIDMLICHSGAVYPALRLCIGNDLPVIKSLAMLNPGAFSLTTSLTPYKPIYFMVRLSEFPIALKFLKIIGPYLMKLTKIPVRLDNYMDPLLSVATMCFSDFPKAKDHFKTISMQKMPIFFAFGEDDKLMEKHRSYDTAYLLGANDPDIFHYNKNGELDHLGVETPFLKVMAFEEGSHYVFWKHPDIINEAITSFLLRATK